MTNDELREAGETMIAASYGNMIEYRPRGRDTAWMTVSASELCWNWDDFEYRVKKDLTPITVWHVSWSDEGGRQTRAFSEHPVAKHMVDYLRKQGFHPAITVLQGQEQCG